MCWITVFPDFRRCVYGTWWKNSSSSSGQLAMSSYSAAWLASYCAVYPVPVAAVRSTPMPSRSAK
ncbi:MAG TPA: hypothetical protein VFE59_11895 [Trebonia sp.]|nr:hypothetical protein [Trebonia sp.]